jgi:hypothetical protein
MNMTIWTGMGHIWLGILTILAIDAVLVAVVAAITFAFTRPTRGPTRRHVRRFADAVARGDFAAAEAAAKQAITDREQANHRRLTSAS